jgi:phosphoglycerate dehydrogenase-like enzyme
MLIREYRTQLIAAIAWLLAATLAAATDVQAVEPDPEFAALRSSYVIDEAAEPIRAQPGWRPPQDVVVVVPAFVADWRPDYRDWIQAAAGEANVTFAANPAELRDAAVDADVVFGSCQILTEASTNLRWFQRYGSGMEDCLANPALAPAHVVLTNTAGLDGPYIAEHAITMMLMLSHRMHQYFQNQLKRDWNRRPDFQPSVRAVRGQTLLVVGLGGIGTQVAQRAAGLDMRVIATRNSSRAGPAFVDYVGLSSELMTLAAEADFVVSTVPLTPETTGMYDRAFFRAMKDSAYFINVARGESVVTDDLVAALEAGEIAGAAMDVTDPDPLPAEHPLWTLPTVLITPHVATRSGVASTDMMVFVRENLRRYTAGEPLLNVVDRARGY